MLFEVVEVVEVVVKVMKPRGQMKMGDGSLMYGTFVLACLVAFLLLPKAFYISLFPLFPSSTDTSTRRQGLATGSTC